MTLDVFLPLIQASSVVVLTLVGLSRHPNRASGKSRNFRWFVVAIAAVAYIATTFGIAYVNSKEKKRLRQEKEEIRDILHNKTAGEIMEAQVPICQVKSPFPLKPWEKVEDLQIRLPAEGSKLSGQFYVEGLVPDPESNVFVIFHSIALPDFHVQPEATVCDDNIWRIRISMEKTVGISVGSVFEIMAVANPKVELKEGDVLGGWPEAQWTSEVIGVIRRWQTH